MEWYEKWDGHWTWGDDRLASTAMAIRIVRTLGQLVVLWFRCWLALAAISGCAYVLARWAVTPPTPVRLPWLPTTVLLIFAVFNLVWWVMAIAMTATSSRQPGNPKDG